MEFNIIPKFLDSALTPVSQEIGARLSDIISLAFTPIIKKRAVRDKNLESFLKILQNKVDNIPEDRLTEPPLNVVGPALEGIGKYYHDEEYLRELFASLICSSMQKNSRVHPSFVEIIKQLSPSDAEFFTSLFEEMTATINNHPIIIPLDKRNVEFVHIYSKFEIDTKKLSAFISLSETNKNIKYLNIANLSRLQLINPKKTILSFDEMKKHGISLDNYDDVIVEKYTIFVTEYGYDFYDVCCK